MGLLFRWLRVKRNEVPRLALAAAVFFIVAVNDGIVKSVAAAVFNMRAGVEQLPLMYTWVAFFFSLGMALLSYLSSRTPRQSLLFALFGLLAAVLFCNTAMLYVDGRAAGLGYPFYAFLFVSSELVRSLASFYIWIAAGGICYAARAKVFFPLLAASTTLGDIAGGLLVRLLGRTLEAHLVYGLAACGMVGVIVLLRPLVRRYFVSHADAQDGGAPLGENLRYFGRTRYLQLLFALSVAVFALYTAVHYGFNVVTRQAYADEGGIAAAFGLFYATAGVVTLAVTSLLLPFLLRWLGSGAVYQWVCLAYTGVCLALWASFSGVWGVGPLVGAFVFNLANFLLLDSVVAPTYQVLVKLVPPRYSDATRMLMEGGFMLLGGLLGAALSLAHARGLVDLAGLFAGLSLLAAGMAVLGWMLRRAYTRMLIRAVHEQNLDTEDDQTMAAFGRVAASEGFARGLLLDPDDGVRQLGIEILRQHPGAALDECLGLLQHQNPRVRGAALAALVGGGQRARSGVLPLLSDPDGEVRGAALAALERLLTGGDAVSPAEGAALAQGVLPLLEGAAPQARGRSVVILQRLGHRDSAAARQRQLDALLHSEESDEQIAGLRGAAAVSHAAAAARALELCRHEDPGVREAAAGALSGRQGVEALLELLADPDPDVVGAAVGGLKRLRARDDIEGWLEKGLRQGALPQFCGLLRVLGAEEGTAWRARLLEECRARLLQANRYIAARALLRGQRHVAADILADQLLLQVRTIRDAVVGLLGEWEDRQVVEALVERLEEGDAAGRSQAIELLDNIAEREILEYLLPLLEDDDAEREATALERSGWESVAIPTVLAYVLGAASPWTQLAGVWAAYSLGRADAVEIGHLQPVARRAADELGRNKKGNAMDVQQPLTTMEKIAFLRASPFFASLPLEELYQVSLAVEEEGVRGGEQVIRAGDVGDKMYIAVHGKLEVLRADGQRLAVLEEKAVFGEMALIDAEPRSATVTALEDARLLSLRRGNFERILRRYSSIAFNTMRILSGRLRESMGG